MLEGLGKSSADFDEGVLNKVKALEEKSGFTGKVKGCLLQTGLRVFG